MREGSTQYLPRQSVSDWGGFQILLGLLKPETEIIDDIVFLSGRMVLNPERRREAASLWFKLRNSESVELINSFNWIELNDVVTERVPEPRIGEFLDLFLRNWNFELQSRYPNRNLVTRILEPAETGDWYGIGFEQGLVPE